MKMRAALSRLTSAIMGRGQSLRTAFMSDDVFAVRKIVLRDPDCLVRVYGDAGETALHLAMRHGARYCANELLAHGAVLDACDAQGATCRTLAVRAGWGIEQRDGRCAVLRASPVVSASKNSVIHTPRITFGPRQG